MLLVCPLLSPSDIERYRKHGYPVIIILIYLMAFPLPTLYAQTEPLKSFLTTASFHFDPIFECLFEVHTIAHGRSHGDWWGHFAIYITWMMIRSQGDKDQPSSQAAVFTWQCFGIVSHFFDWIRLGFSPLPFRELLWAFTFFMFCVWMCASVSIRLQLCRELHS